MRLRHTFNRRARLKWKCKSTGGLVRGAPVRRTGPGGASVAGKRPWYPSTWLDLQRARRTQTGVSLTGSSFIQTAGVWSGQAYAPALPPLRPPPPPPPPPRGGLSFRLSFGLFGLICSVMVGGLKHSTLFSPLLSLLLCSS